MAVRFRDDCVDGFLNPVSILWERWEWYLLFVVEFFVNPFDVEFCAPEFSFGKPYCVRSVRE